jgi:lysophospholipase L1-like esterase
MRQILVYADSLSWGIIPMTRKRLPFASRWPGVMENELVARGHSVRVIEDCLNGRRTVWDDPLKPGRNGLQGLQQRIEINSPLSLVIVMLGTNDFQAMHDNTAQDSALGLLQIVQSIRSAPIEPGMPIPPILVVAPPPIGTPAGDIATKFAGGNLKCVGLADAYRAVCNRLNCAFVDSGAIITASVFDGVHLDEPQHAILGRALVSSVLALLVESSAPNNTRGGPEP